MQAGDYDQLLYTGKYCVSCSSQVLGHPDKGGCDAGSQAAPYRADDHKQKECADQSGKKRRYQQPDYFRYFLFKKDIQLGCNDADQQGNDDSALETHQFYRKPEDMQRSYLCGSLSCGVSVGQAV